MSTTSGTKLGAASHEAGWPLHHVQHLLGHKSLEQTTTYLNVTLTGAGGEHAAVRCRQTVAGDGKADQAPVRNGPGAVAPHPALNYKASHDVPGVVQRSTRVMCIGGGAT
jgi:hypothetical protein